MPQSLLFMEMVPVIDIPGYILRKNPGEDFAG
jgi:hypothetical protein